MRYRNPGSRASAGWTMVGVLAMPCFSVASTISSIRRSSTACQSQERLTSVSRSSVCGSGNAKNAAPRQCGRLRRHPRRDVAHHLEAVPGAGLLECADHRFGQAFIEFQERRTGRLDRPWRVGSARARILKQDGVLEAGLAGADERDRRRTAAARCAPSRSAFAQQQRRCRRGRRPREWLSRHAGDRAAPPMASASVGIVGRQMEPRMSTSAGQGEVARKISARPGPVACSAMAATAPFETSMVALLRRSRIGLDDGNAIELKFAFCRGDRRRRRAPRRPRLLSTPIVNLLQSAAFGNMNMSIYSY